MEKPVDEKDKIIVALDVPTEEEALRLIDQLRDSVGFFKIGLQLYTRLGPAIVGKVKETGVGVFLDLKLHDIPATVRRAVESASALDADLLTVHLSGGSEMLKAAEEGRSNPSLALLGVSVLTSSTEESLRETGIRGAVEDQVLRLARLGVDAGLRGIVASPREITLLRQVFGEEIKIVTPGIRPEWAQADDQKRVMTPAQALELGADYLVIGRPITADPDPPAAVRKIVNEIT